MDCRVKPGNDDVARSRFQSVIASEAKQSMSPHGRMDCVVARALRNDEAGNADSTVKQQASPRVRILAARIASEFCVSLPPSRTEGAGKAGRRLAPAVSCANAHSKSAHEHTGSAGASRPSLRSGFTAYFVISPVNGSLPPSPLRSLLLKNLTPAPRRQDHTTSPSATTAFVFRRRPRPPHPTARP